MERDREGLKPDSRLYLARLMVPRLLVEMDGDKAAF